MEKREIVIIGAGPAGMAAAVRLNELGYRDVLVLEKENSAGGVLRQCIHSGFGLTKFGKNYTGPEYRHIYEEMLLNTDVGLMTGATVMEAVSVDTYNCSCSPEERINDSVLNVVVRAQTASGAESFAASAVIIASGCRERGRGALGIAGTRPAGVFTAGTAQGMMNLRNVKVGNRVVIIGSGDIGLIMARRFTLEGSRVICVVEKENVCGGLERNRRECLVDFGIPLLLNTVVCRINGRKRVTSVVIRNEDGAEKEVECDTVIISAGLEPEDSFAEKNTKGMFYCGNALYVHDLVDDVSECGENTAMDVAGFLLAQMKKKDFDSAFSSENIEEMRKKRRDYVAKIRIEKNNTKDEGRYIVCTQCPNGCRIDTQNFTGGKCEKGAVFARDEVENPKRILTSSVRISGSERTVSVRTEEAIPLSQIMQSMKVINTMHVAVPVHTGDVICENFNNLGTRLIATGSEMSMNP